MQEIQNHEIEAEQDNLHEQSVYYKKKFRVNGVKKCQAIAMDKNCEILVCGSCWHIKIWKVNQTGLLTLLLKLRGHKRDISCLCFSKKYNWFISGSKDKTLRYWKEQQNEWACLQILEGHKNCVTDAALNAEEDQLISCSLDTTIRVWGMMGKKQWDCIQILFDHCRQVNFLSLHYTFLASVGADKMILWEKGNQGSWKFNHIISRQLNGMNLRTCFIDNSMLITTTFCKLRLFKLFQQPEAQSEILFKETIEFDFGYFPLAYSFQKQILLCRHGKETYILKKQDNEKFQIVQIFKGDYTGRFLTEEGDLLVLANSKRQNMEVFFLKKNCKIIPF